MESTSRMVDITQRIAGGEDYPRQYVVLRRIGHRMTYLVTRYISLILSLSLVTGRESLVLCLDETY